MKLRSWFYVFWFGLRLKVAWWRDKRMMLWLINKCPREDTGRHLTRLKWQASQYHDPEIRDAYLDLFAAVEARIKQKHDALQRP